MILAALILIAQPGSTPSHPDATPPRAARAALASYFSIADYPAEARAARQQGTVGVVLNVGADGRVRNCLVSQSSGSASLDVATCRILIVRARYTPARDPQGRPRDSIVDGRIRWILPAD